MRIPCNDFKDWMGLSGYDDARAGSSGSPPRAGPGPTCGSSRRACSQAGDAIDVVHRPGHGVTSSTMFRALTTERELLPRAARVDGLVAEARATAEKYVARA